MIINKAVDNIRKTDIELVLKSLTNNAKGPDGLIDRNLFTGGNRLRAIMDPQTCLWYLKYDKGIIPPAFRTKFTSYSKLLDFVTDHMRKRNIDIVEIKD